MKKIAKILLISSVIAALFITGVLVADKQTLRSQIIRLHVVANSNSGVDQSAKLSVRDAVIAYLDQQLKGSADCGVAEERIQECIPQIRQVAVQALRNIGNEDTVSVNIAEEAFDRRDYDTFSLPSGIYQSLRINIGEAEGKNWWCVVFPAFCKPATAACFKETAINSGMNEDLAASLSNDTEISYRFFLLDCIGKVENFFKFS